MTNNQDEDLVKSRRESADGSSPAEHSRHDETRIDNVAFSTICPNPDQDGDDRFSFNDAVSRGTR
jgi:hypothetical protein